jgi:uncharacterized protein Usg
LWNNILSWLERRKGWIRTDIIQKLYPLTGTFPKAKEIFDTYYAEVLIIICSFQLMLMLSGDTISKNYDCILLNKWLPKAKKILRWNHSIGRLFSVKIRHKLMLSINNGWRMVQGRNNQSWLRIRLNLWHTQLKIVMNH